MKYSSGISIPPSAGRSLRHSVRQSAGVYLGLCVWDERLATGGEGETETDSAVLI